MEDFEKIKDIFAYLDKYYIIKDWYYFDRLGEQEWGYEVINSLFNVYGYSKILIEETFMSWTLKKGFSHEQYNNANGGKKLKSFWSTTLHQDLVNYGISNPKDMAVKLLIKEIATEVDLDVLNKLVEFDEVKNKNFLEIMGCVGYETTEIEYDSETFIPKKFFVKMKENKIENLRKNNELWQKYVKN